MLLQEQGRAPDAVEIVTSPGEKPCDADTLARYAEQGVSEVVVICFAQSLSAFEREADRLAETLVRPAVRL
jgi:hypothetical protein